MRFRNAVSIFALSILAAALVAPRALTQDASYKSPTYLERGTALHRDQAGGSGVFAKRIRTSTANVNSGATLLPAIPGVHYRLLTAKAISIGGAASAVTTVDILATQATASVKLVAFAQANLTQSTVLTAGGTGAAVLTDGASYMQNDVNTAITIGKTGSSLATSTNIDVIIEYAIE